MQILKILEGVIEQRSLSPQPGSYTNSLLEVKGLVERKVNEEAYEVIEASLNNNKAALVEEAADLLFHLLVLLHKRGVSLEDVCAVLEKRRRV